MLTRTGVQVNARHLTELKTAIEDLISQAQEQPDDDGVWPNSHNSRSGLCGTRTWPTWACRSQALLLALLQVIPQPGQRAAGVQLGYRVEAGREVLGGWPLPRLDLADHVVRDVGLGGQVLLGQARSRTPRGSPASSRTSRNGLSTWTRSTACGAWRKMTQTPISTPRAATRTW